GSRLTGSLLTELPPLLLRPLGRIARDLPPAPLVGAVLRRSESGRCYGPDCHPDGIAVSCETSCFPEKRVPAIVTASTSFNDARICQSGLRRPNSAGAVPIGQCARP